MSEPLTKEKKVVCVSRSWKDDGDFIDLWDGKDIESAVEWLRDMVVLIDNLSKEEVLELIKTAFRGLRE